MKKHQVKLIAGIASVIAMAIEELAEQSQKDVADYMRITAAAIGAASMCIEEYNRAERENASDIPF